MAEAAGHEVASAREGSSAPSPRTGRVSRGGLTWRRTSMPNSGGVMAFHGVSSPTGHHPLARLRCAESATPATASSVAQMTRARPGPSTTSSATARVSSPERDLALDLGGHILDSSAGDEVDHMFGRSPQWGITWGHARTQASAYPRTSCGCAIIHPADLWLSAQPSGSRYHQRTRADLGR